LGLDRPEQVERLAVLDIVPAREMLRRLDASVASEDVIGAEVPECGHFIAEERPEALLEHLHGFLADGTPR